MKDANYYDTFIEVAEDCPVATAEVPSSKGNEPSIPALQYDLVANNPYRYTQEEVLFTVHVRRKSIPRAEHQVNLDEIPRHSPAATGAVS